MQYENARDYILHRLKTELAPHLTYHCFDHTMDVFESAIFIAGQYNLDAESLVLLKTAALYHDSGFLEVYGGHEAKGCELARKKLPEFDYSEFQIERICQMIMATQIPQAPQDLCGEILCDADLDYLGRDDFKSIGDTLFAEFLDQGIVQNEEGWNRLQIGFLSNHRYHTRYAQAHRQPVKKVHLDQLEVLVATYS
ncbi:MAG: HD domain-containing protein [Salibacteraceae bacterium]